MWRSTKSLRLTVGFSAIEAQMKVLRALSIAIPLSGSAGCRGAPTSISVGDEAAARGFELAVGRTATLSGGAITFLAIIGDDRCPRGVNCAESGPVTARLHADPGLDIDLAILDRGQPN